ncbi:MAG: hypothetical protein ACREYE_27945, partial [Gammaproteobacteria bacterium]
PHVFQYTLRFLRSGGTRSSFARDGFFTNSQSDLGGNYCGGGKSVHFSDHSLRLRRSGQVC